MAAFYSDQVTKYNQTVPAKMIGKNENCAPTKLWFSYTCLGTEVIADTIDLCTIPANARVLGGALIVEANTASSTFDVGYSGAGTRYAAVQAISSAGKFEFGHTIALNHGDVLSAKTVLQGTVRGATLTVAKKIYGYVEVLLP